MKRSWISDCQQSFVGDQRSEKFYIKRVNIHCPNIRWRLWLWCSILIAFRISVWSCVKSFNFVDSNCRVLRVWVNILYSWICCGQFSGQFSAHIFIDKYSRNCWFRDLILSTKSTKIGIRRIIMIDWLIFGV
jgi:hypothetical protein